MTDLIRVSFLGIETSSPNLERAKLVEIGIVSSVFGATMAEYSTSSWATYLHPPQGLIEPEASAFHNITDKMVQSAPLVEEWDVQEKLDTIMKSTDILCTYSTGYIAEIINKYPSLMFTFSQNSCCKRLLSLYTLVPRIWPSAMENKLQYLRYFLDLDPVINRIHPERSENKFGTLDKCWISEAILMRMVYESGESWESLFEKSQTVVPATRMPFGKYKGKELQTLMVENFGYLKSLWDKQISWIQIDHPDLYLYLKGYME